MSASLRIALIAASPAIVGGHSVQARAIAKGLSAANHRIAFIPIDVRFPMGLRWVRRLPYARTLLNQILYIPSLFRIAASDVVHVFSASYWSFLLGPAPAILFAKLLRKRVVLHYHSGEADDHLRRWRTTVRPFLRLVDEIVVPSGYLQGVFESHGYRARVIPNLVDTSEFQFRRRSALRPRLLSVRNLENYYRVDNTIAAFEQLKKRFPDATLTVVGCGSQERRLRRLIDERRITAVEFLGPIDPAELPRVYDRADIFVNSSVVDNQPVSILEAFAAGLPVVSTPTGDIAAMLRGGEAGLLVGPEDPAAMAEAITRLLDQPDLAARIISRARQELDRYTWSRVGDQWQEVYATVANAGPAKEVLAHGA